MAHRLLWIGSVGPYLFDTDSVYSGEDGHVLKDVNRRGIATDEVDPYTDYHELEYLPKGAIEEIIGELPDVSNIITLINESEEGIVIEGDNIQLNEDTEIEGSFTIVGNAIVSGQIGSDNWGEHAGCQLNLVYGGMRFGGFTAPGFEVLSTGDIALASGNKILFDGINGSDYIHLNSGHIEFVIGGTSRMVLTSAGNLDLDRNSAAVAASTNMLRVGFDTISAGGAYNLIGILSALVVHAQSLTSVKGFSASIQANTTGGTVGFSAYTCVNTGDGDLSAFKADTIAATGDGDVHGFLITDTLVTSGAGTVYAIKSEAVEDSYLAGDLCFLAGEGISLNAVTKTQTIAGDAGGTNFDVPTGDNFDFKVNSVSVVDIDSGGLNITTAGKTVDMTQTGYAFPGGSTQAINISWSGPSSVSAYANIFGVSIDINTSAYECNTAYGIYSRIYANVDNVAKAIYAASRNYHATKQAYGVETYVYANGNAYGIRIGTTVSVSGSAIGLYIADSITAGSIGYAIYSAAAEASYLAGDLHLASGKMLALDGLTGNVRFVWNAGASQIDVFVGGNLAGHINEADGFVND